MIENLFIGGDLDGQWKLLPPGIMNRRRFRHSIHISWDYSKIETYCLEKIVANAAVFQV